MSVFDIDRMTRIVEALHEDLQAVSEGISAGKPRPASWSIREIVGQLIDSAANNHQRFVRLQDGHLEGFPGYDNERWMEVQRYGEFDLQGLVGLWFLYNRLLLHLIRNIDPGSLANEWRNGNERFSLERLVNDYFRHIEKHHREVKERIEELREPGIPDPPQTAGAYAMILHQAPVRLDNERLSAKIRSEFSDDGALIEISSGVDTLAAVMENRTFLVLQVPTPIPEHDLAGPAETAWYWPDVREKTAGHGAHLIVQVSSAEPLLDRMLLLARFCGVLLRELAGIGVYLASSSQLVQRELFLSYLEAGSRIGALPVPLLVHIAGYRNERHRTDMYTVGLAELGFMDFEVSDSPHPWKEIYEVMLDLAHHVLRSRSVIPDGAVRGTGGFPRIRVQHERSVVFSEDTVVMRLYL